MRRVTREEVLATLRDEYRYSCAFDPESQEGFDLTFLSTIADWRTAEDLKGWRGLARALNETWGMTVPLSAWKRVLLPARVRTLRDVCELIATNALIPDAAPFAPFGKPCGSAGAFRALRVYLERRDIDVTGLRPSTPIVPILSRHSVAVTDAARILAPGRIPLPSFPGWMLFRKLFGFPTADWPGISTVGDLARAIAEARQISA
jgi:hypothetical protein